MKILNTILTLTFLQLNIVSQSPVLQEQTKSISDSISKFLIVEGYNSGEQLPNVINQWNLYERLNTVANENELYQLTKNENAVVRCYAFMSLINKSDSLTLITLKETENDTTMVNSLHGCYHSNSTVFEFYLTRIQPEFYNQLCVDDKKYIKKLLKDNNRSIRQVRK